MFGSSTCCYLDSRLTSDKLCCAENASLTKCSLKKAFSTMRIMNLFCVHFQPNSQLLQSKPPKCPQNSLAHLRGLVDVSSNTVTTKAEICATPPQSRRRFFIPKHLRSPFGIYKNRNNGAGTEQNYTFSGI